MLLQFRRRTHSISVRSRWNGSATAFGGRKLFRTPIVAKPVTFPTYFSQGFVSVHPTRLQLPRAIRIFRGNNFRETKTGCMCIVLKAAVILLKRITDSPSAFTWMPINYLWKSARNINHRDVRRYLSVPASKRGTQSVAAAVAGVTKRFKNV